MNVAPGQRAHTLMLRARTKAGATRCWPPTATSSAWPAPAPWSCWLPTRPTRPSPPPRCAIPASCSSRWASWWMWTRSWRAWRRISSPPRARSQRAEGKLSNGKLRRQGACQSGGSREGKAHRRPRARGKAEVPHRRNGSAEVMIGKNGAVRRRTRAASVLWSAKRLAEENLRWQATSRPAVAVRQEFRRNSPCAQAPAFAVRCACDFPHGGWPFPRRNGQTDAVLLLGNRQRGNGLSGALQRRRVRREGGDQADRAARATTISAPSGARKREWALSRNAPRSGSGMRAMGISDGRPARRRREPCGARSRRCRCPGARGGRCCG